MSISTEPEIAPNHSGDSGMFFPSGRALLLLSVIWASFTVGFLFVWDDLPPIWGVLGLSVLLVSAAYWVWLFLAGVIGLWREPQRDAVGRLVIVLTLGLGMLFYGDYLACLGRLFVSERGYMRAVAAISHQVEIGSTDFAMGVQYRAVVEPGTPLRVLFIRGGLWEGWWGYLYDPARTTLRGQKLGGGWVDRVRPLWGPWYWCVVEKNRHSVYLPRSRDIVEAGCTLKPYNKRLHLSAAPWLGSGRAPVLEWRAWCFRGGPAGRRR